LIHIILHQPEIPPNTGNIIRLAANIGCVLHIIEPMGFKIDDKHLRRAGLDYAHLTDIRTWSDFTSFKTELPCRRLFTLSTHHLNYYSDCRFEKGDGFLFGAESRGLPVDIRNSVPPSQRITLPMAPENRSLNLANTVAVVAYEAWRQLEFAGCRPRHNTDAFRLI